MAAQVLEKCGVTRADVLSRLASTPDPLHAFTHAAEDLAEEPKQIDPQQVDRLLREAMGQCWTLLPPARLSFHWRKSCKADQAVPRQITLLAGVPRLEEIVADDRPRNTTAVPQPAGGVLLIVGAAGLIAGLLLQRRPKR